MRHRLLLAIYRLTRYHAWLVLIIFFSLAIAALLYLRDLPIDSSQVRLLPKDDPIVNKIIERSEELQTTEQVSVLLTLRDPPSLESQKVQQLEQAGEAIRAELTGKSEIVEIILNRQADFEPPIDLLELDELEGEIDSAAEQLATLTESIPESLPAPEDERTLAQQYSEVADSLEALFGSPAILRPDLVREALQNLSENVADLEEGNERLLSYLDEQPALMSELRSGINEVDSWLNELPVNEESSILEEELNLSIDKNSLLVRVQPTQSSQLGTQYNRVIINEVNQALDSIDFEQYGVRVEGLTGPYMFSVESDDQLQSDTRRTALITIVGVLLLFFIVLKRYFYPLLATFPVLIALIFTIALAKLIFGGLNLVTAFLPAIILGLGIDYGIQFIVHYLEQRQGSRRVGPALRTTLLDKGSAMLSAATATSLVLFALGFISNTVGLSEIGYILGFGVLLSCMLTLLVLPSLIFSASIVMRRRLSAHPPKPWRLTPIANAVIRYKWLVLAATVIGSIFMIIPASKISFSFISDTLQPKNLESTRVGELIEEKFEERPNRGNAFAFFVPDSPQSKAIATALNEVEGVESVVSIYSWVEDPDDITRTQEILAKLMTLTTELLSAIDAIIPQLAIASEEFDRREQDKDPDGNLVTDDDGDPVIKLSTVVALEDVVYWLQRGENDASTLSPDNDLQDQLAALRESTQSILDRMTELDEAGIQREIAGLILDLNALIPRILSLQQRIPDPSDLQEIADTICESLCTTDPDTGETNQIIYVLVNVDWLWDSELYAQLLGDFESIWSDFIGLPQIRIQLEGYMEDDFWKSTIAAIIIITIILAIDFVSVRIWGATLFSLIALGLGYLWLLGVMTFRGIDFNVANILISPLLLGLGVDNCVYLLHRYRDIKAEIAEDEEMPSISTLMSKALSSTSVPILANTGATMIAFGSLMFAETPILRFLGESATWGIGFMTLFSLTFLPSIIALRR